MPEKKIVKKYFRSATPAARLQKASGWTQQEMAEKFNVSQSTISRWILGVNKPVGNHKALMKSLLDQFGRTK